MLRGVRARRPTATFIGRRLCSYARATADGFDFPRRVVQNRTLISAIYFQRVSCALNDGLILAKGFLDNVVNSLFEVLLISERLDVQAIDFALGNVADGDYLALGGDNRRLRTYMK
ncbi:hypothetical protein [Mycolicibacterium lacusdiani]|uniref:hypothetical protein n=1 Tax=Mycolicibacterium lacusdiani TaxID=2895283 RepID=UPI001F1FDE27|nr:hypothetical protein [Mycolicibacterium lacusdiani]